MKNILLSVLLLAVSLSASDTKHIEMDYGNILSLSLESQWPKDEAITHKALVLKMDTKALPEKGTPIGKGRFIKTSKTIEGSSLKGLYQKQRERLNGYLIAVPDGKYKVTLRFAEVKRKNPGERVFDILLQGKKVKADFDAFKDAGGALKTVDLTFENIDLKKFLRLEFVQKSTRSTPAVAAIEIENDQFTKKINCGGDALGDYEADWGKKEYMEDPFSTGVIFDTELMRYSALWFNGFVKLKGTAYDATHGSYPEIQGDQVLGSGYVPGWVPDGKKHIDSRKNNLGNLPKDWARFKGVYRTSTGPVFQYTVANNSVLERMELLKVKGDTISQAYVSVVEAEKALNADKLLCELEADKVAEFKFSTEGAHSTWSSKELQIVATGKFKADDLKQIKRKSGEQEIVSLYLRVTKSVNIALLPSEDLKALADLRNQLPIKVSLKDAITKFDTSWAGTVTTEVKAGEEDGMLTVDEITLPDNNPWRSWMRPGAFDFFNGGKSLAVSTWSGDVWVAQDISQKKLVWKRFAAGLFHPLGLKVVDEKIYVQCRDGIYILEDINKDGESDYRKVFNNDVLITVNFHEFSFELHRDPQGNFYFVKGAPVKAGGEGFDLVTKHHGSLFKVSPDGEKLEVIATGFRAPNGMGISPEGQITTSDNEGNWVAATPINWVKEGGFYGVHPTAHKDIPQKRSALVCWIPHEIDNSAGGQVWVPKGKWGSLGGQMIHISYGQAKIFNVLTETVDGTIQGGVYDLKPSGGFDAGIMRGRFNEADNALYLCGLKGWQTKGVKDGGLYRVRYLNKEKAVATKLAVGKNGLKISFNETVDPVSALDAGNYDISQWVYEISHKYGSRRYKVPQSAWDLASEFSPVPAKELAAFNSKEFDSEAAKNAAKSKLLEKYVGEDTVKIKSISLSDDGKTVFLEIPSIAPVMQMKTSFNIKTAAGKKLKSEIYHTIHKLGDWQGKPGKAATSIELDKPQPGIVVKYTHRGQQKSDTVVQRFAAFHIPEKTAVTQLLDHGPFDARMDGFIEVARNMPVEIFTAGKGKVTISVNGKVICKDVDVSSADVYVNDLKKGFNKLLVEYSGPSKGDASFRLYWRSVSYFPKEPIPSTSLYHEAGDKDVVHSRLLREGLELAINNKCFSCHSEKDAVLPELKDANISLADLGGKLNTAWVSAWITTPKDMRHSARMPAMLKKNIPEPEWQKAALDIATFLTEEKGAALALKGDLTSGEKLFGDLGCASCHAFKEDDLSETMLSLEFAGFKFKTGAMAKFLQNPQAHNPQSRMPNFGLSEQESQDLEVFVRSKAKKMMSAQVLGDAKSGKSYFEKLNCASCHGGTAVKPKSVASLFGKSGGCLIDSGNGKPKYTIPAKDKERLAYFLKHGSEAVRHNQPIEFAARQLKNLNCNNCHSVDHLAANWQSPNVKPSDLPPSITHAGEKVQLDYLKKIFHGKTDKMRPWMAARMPAFKTQADDLATGLAAMHGFGENTKSPAQEHMTVGDKLSKQTGFACIVCHAIGDTKALAPFGAPGLNLELSRERLTYEYYMRWMLNPQRVIPSTHMTRFSNDHKTTALPDLKGDAHEQFKAIWSYLETLK